MLDFVLFLFLFLNNGFHIFTDVVTLFIDQLLDIGEPVFVIGLEDKTAPDLIKLVHLIDIDMLEPEDASSLFPLPENQLYLVQDMLFLLDLLGEVEPEEPILEQEVTLPLDQLFFVVPAPFLIAAVIEIFLLALVHMQVVLLLDHAASLRQFIQNAAGVGVLLKTAPRIDLEVELVFALVQVDRPYLGGVYQRLVKAFVFVVLHEAVLYLQLYVLGLDV